MGSISMTCYGVGVDGEQRGEADGAAGSPREVPADQTNM
jgi:4,5-DOPA dioxygenase extradiol